MKKQVNPLLPLSTFLKKITLRNCFGIRFPFENGCFWCMYGQSLLLSVDGKEAQCNCASYINLSLNYLYPR